MPPTRIGLAQPIAAVLALLVATLPVPGPALAAGPTSSVTVAAPIERGESHGYTVHTGEGPLRLQSTGSRLLIQFLGEATGGTEAFPIVPGAEVTLPVSSGSYTLVLTHLDHANGAYALTLTRGDGADLTITAPPPRFTGFGDGVRWQQGSGAVSWSVQALGAAPDQPATPSGPLQLTVGVGAEIQLTAPGLPARLQVPDTRRLGEGLHPARMTLAAAGGFSARALQLLVDDHDTYADVPPGHWARAEVEIAAELGLAVGYPDGGFRPERPVTRAEFIKLLCGALGLYASPPDRPTFSDTRPGDWYYPFVEAAAVAGIASGEPDGRGGRRFQPDRGLTRVEAAVLVARAAGVAIARDQSSPAPAPGTATARFIDGTDLPDWAAPAVAAAAESGLVTGFPDGSFRPAAPVSRAQAVTLAVRLVR